MNRYADVESLIRATDQAFQATLHAVLDGDRHGAREVLQGAAHRRGLVDTAQAALRARPWVPKPQLVAELRFVVEVGRLGDLVEDLARHVVSGSDPARLSPSRRLEVAALLDAGERRFHHLADGVIAGGLDPTYRGCAATLYAVADRAGRDHSATVELCGGLAAGLLRVSRYAAAAA
ncbi:MAG TPA: hypothetical protein VMF51_24590 [Nocardioides sp.]|uniref:hypothetical protein n=1 Tax=Nocardioides sp. TaxID=35761 RepID=UPI002CCF0744|nr:hypothetical protein [Nocardioides sp.]HTW18325.1 hypothetical protein [Nocardioides sp.]